MDMREIAARNVESDRYCAGGEKQRAVSVPAAVSEPDLARLRLDRRRAGAELQLDPVLDIELLGTQRYPFFGCVPGEIVLGQIGPIVGSRIVGAQQHDRADV